MHERRRLHLPRRPTFLTLSRRAKRGSVLSMTVRVFVLDSPTENPEGPKIRDCRRLVSLQMAGPQAQSPDIAVPMEHFWSRLRLIEQMPGSLQPLMIGRVAMLLLLIVAAALVPATAIAGFCAKMPCCFSQASEGTGSQSLSESDCCSTVSCAEAPSQDITLSETAKQFASNAPVSFAALVDAPHTPFVCRTCEHSSPPRTSSQRLSALSTFLI